MNLRNSQDRRSATGKVWTEHDDQLIELIAGLFDDAGVASHDVQEADGGHERRSRRRDAMPA